MGQTAMKSADSETRKRNEELYAAVRSTGLASKHVRQLHRQFKASFPSGYMTKRDFVEFYRKQFADEENSEVYCERIFGAIDGDGNNRVSFEEYMKFFKLVTNGSPAERLRWTFRLYDLDNSKEVTRDELETVLETMYKARGFKNPGAKAKENAAELLRRLDADKNGELTEKEFVKAAAAGDNEIMNLLLGV